jgi:alkanesulfonate monooxygenase SsuD/methylene tetrahydromethanopterin reductase-like flavin-dependent oxidoreductase (luciferase family)
VYGAKPFRVKNGRQAHIEPMSAIAALGAITKHIGLVSTCTTSYNEPYNVARRFLTIDHISGGRAGWNLVTSQAEDEAVNFGRDQHFEHGIRYDRAAEFHDVVIGLWDSWEDDAFLRDKESGVVRLRQDAHLRHKGQHFTVRGPSTSRVCRKAGRWWQAGSSDIGMELAAHGRHGVHRPDVIKEAGPL